VSLVELCDKYFQEHFKQTDIALLYETQTPPNSLQERAVAWGFNEACKRAGLDPKVLLEEEEEYDL